MVTIVAHRGASKRAHENTLEAFMQAASLGADMIELDVRKTADGILVVFHDPGFDGSSTAGMLAGMTFAKARQHAAKKKFTLATVDEVFSALAGKVQFDIELKEPGYAGEVVALARKRLDIAACVFTSFDPRIIAAVKAEDPHLVTGLILANTDAFRWCSGTGAEVFAPEKKLFSLKREFFEDAHRQGRHIAVWTVDSRPLLARLLADPIVSAIITNYPDRALALRNQLS